MRWSVLFLSAVLLLLCACELDGFLFNAKQIDRYTLPNNTIPDSLIHPVTFTSGGHRLHGFYVHASDPQNRLTLLYCHGNKHNIDHYWDRVMLLHKLGHVLVFDYRGFGLSEGEPSESGLLRDGEAALRWLLEQIGPAPDSLLLYGFSLGNVVSIHLAAEVIRPLGLIAEAPFASANSLTQGSLAMDLPPGWLTDGEFDNAGAIKKISTPLLLIHGEDDDFVRYRDNGRVLFNNAPAPKTLLLVPDAGHSDIPNVLGGALYLEKLKAWIRSL